MNGRARSADPWRDRKLVAAAMEEPVRRGLPRPARVAVAGCGVRSGRGPLRRGLEAGSGRTGRVSESARDLQSRRRRRCADGGRLVAGCAAGARRGRRPHRPDDRICRAACADASPAGTLFAGKPAREALGAEIAMAGGRDLGRHHGARHARRQCGRGAAADRLSRLGLEPQPEDRSTASNAFTANRSSMRSCARPTSWSACCR